MRYLRIICIISIRSWFFCGKANVGHLEKSEKSQGIVLSNEVAGSSANFNSNSSKFYKINHSKCYMGHLRDTSLICLFCEKFFYIVVVQKANSWYSFKSKNYVKLKYLSFQGKKKDFVLKYLYIQFVVKSRISLNIGLSMSLVSVFYVQYDPGYQ